MTDKKRPSARRITSKPLPFGPEAQLVEAVFARLEPLPTLSAQDNTNLFMARLRLQEAALLLKTIKGS